jgi:lysophospholipase L1-like esterase
MIVKTLARSSTRLVSSHTALGVGPPAFISEWVSSSVSGGILPVTMSLSTMATSVMEAAPDTISEVQTLGEKAFAAAFLIALCQAAIAVFQYQTNPSGQLVVPPGPTQGTAMPLIENDCETDTKPSKKGDSWLEALKELESTFSIRETSNNDENKIKFTSPAKQYAATMHRINRSLVFLLPWATNVFAFLLERNVHLFHLGFIVALAQLFDFPHRLFPLPKKQELTATAKTTVENILENTTYKEVVPQRILVLGDSLAAGVGAVNLYEADQEEMEGRHQSLNEENGPGPVFPRVLAQTLSQRTGKPVHWRSEGVVGGDTGNIEEMCLYALQEEVDKGQAPDVVVVISGINDLKHFATNPVEYPGPQAFRNRLVSIIDKVHEISPDSKIVLPALPTQMFRRDSPLNIFPLVGFVSAIVGFWDAQKKYVAHRYQSANVEYIGLSPSEVYKWYMTDSTAEFGLPTDEDNEDIGLISADGIHPNAKCYAHWAASLAKKLSPVRETTNLEPCNIPSNGCETNNLPSFVHI